MFLKDKVAVVTGASVSVGRELAREFARQGAKVVCAARRAEKLEETVMLIEEEGGQALAVQADVTDRDHVDNLVGATMDAFGQADILFNNAGILDAVGASWEADIDTWWRVLEVDLLGTFLCCRAFLPHMIERDAGVVINMDGGGGTTGSFPGASAYGSAKAAVVRFTQSLAGELEMVGSSVMAVCLNPGFVRSELSEAGVDTDYKARWLPKVKRFLETGHGVPPERCAQTTIKLLKVLSPELNGRTFKNGTDYQAVKDNLHKIKEEDLFTLKYVTL